MCKRPLAHGEGKHIGRAVDTPIPGVEAAAPHVVDDQYAQVTGLRVEGLEQPPPHLFERPGVDRDDLLLMPQVDGHPCFAIAAWPLPTQRRDIRCDDDRWRAMSGRRH